MWMHSLTRRSQRPFICSACRNNLDSWLSTCDWVATSTRLRPSGPSFVQLTRTVRIPTSLILARRCPLHARASTKRKRPFPTSRNFPSKTKIIFLGRTPQLMIWARQDLFVLPMIFLRLPSSLRWLQASSMLYKLPFRMEWRSILLLTSTMTTSAIPYIYGRISNSDMIPRLIVPMWCSSKSRSY